MSCIALLYQPASVVWLYLWCLLGAISTLTSAYQLVACGLPLLPCSTNTVLFTPAVPVLVPSHTPACSPSCSVHTSATRPYSKFVESVVCDSGDVGRCLRRSLQAPELFTAGCFLGGHGDASLSLH